MLMHWILQTQVEASKEPTKIEQVITLLNQIPWVGWVAAIFTVFAIIVAAIANTLGHLDKISDFFQKHFSSELSDQDLIVLRQNLLSQMEIKVAVGLKDSLGNCDSVKIGMTREEQPEQVGRRKSDSIKVPSQSTKSTDTTSSEETYHIFHRRDVGKRLLILGEPEGGKTTELLTIAQRLIDESLEDDNNPIPIIFELSTWRTGTPFIDWVGAQLKQSYKVNKQSAIPLAKRWIEQNQILLLLDGLDTLGQLDQVKCIEAIESFLEEYPALSAIVCCNREEYEQGRKTLWQLRSAVYLRPVTVEQMHKYLQVLDKTYLSQEIQTHPELLELARSPSFLNLLALVYQGQSIQDKGTLLNCYIRQKLRSAEHQRSSQSGKERPQEAMLHYLCWLAKKLEQRQELDFLIENLQPSWLVSDTQKLSYRWIFGLSMGLLLGLLSWPIFGLVFGLSLGSIVELVAIPLFTLAFGLIIGLKEIQLSEKLRWSPIRGLLLGAMGMSTGALIGSQIVGLTTGLIVGLCFGLTGGLRYELVRDRQTPNQGIKYSFSNALIVGLAFGLFSGLISGINTGMEHGLAFGILNGLGIGLYFGFFVVICGLPNSEVTDGMIPVVQHISLRIVLTVSGYTPWNYERFLKDAAEHNFVQAVGGCYRFQGSFKKHFAQMDKQQQKLLSQG